jgi:6-pyruvoyltetrahydropterin/6-carboxytetrahydropterin synthase
MTYYCTKKWGHERGLSCAFRQWRADSHCNKLHGYSIAITLEFETTTLDTRNWVVDFGSLDTLKYAFESLFDHKTLVAKDDPQLSWFQEAFNLGILQLRIVDNVGCEAFAELVYNLTKDWLLLTAPGSVKLTKVTISEHESNSASYSENA